MSVASSSGGVLIFETVDVNDPRYYPCLCTYCGKGVGNRKTTFQSNQFTEYPCDTCGAIEMKSKAALLISRIGYASPLRIFWNKIRPELDDLHPKKLFSIAEAFADENDSLNVREAIAKEQARHKSN